TIALHSDFRIVMKNGAMQKIIHSNDEEMKAADKLKCIDDIILHYRGLIRAGEELNASRLEEELIILN
ncbi:MAG TPA: hypothetical protein PLA88_08445, partial [Bacteroidales bacterium]|nr:hypothetical protein [Bacteroidales bacterium]